MNKSYSTYRSFVSRITIVLGGVFFVCYFLSHFLATERILLGRCDSGWILLSDEGDNCKSYIAPIVKMGPETILDEVASYEFPLSSTPGVGIHLMGTDGLGRDVFAGVIHGGRKSINIAVLAGLSAVFLGWVLGSLSAFYSRMPLTFSSKVVLFILVLVLTLFVGIQWGIGLGISFLVIGGIMIKRWLSNKRIELRPGRSLARGIEWYQALPDLLILLVLSAVIRMDSQILIAAIMTMISWPNFALLARREAYEIMGSPYFQQAVRNQLPRRKLLLNYLLKNSYGLILALVPLTVGRFVLLESTLSFLGLGLPPDIVTIGSMVNAGKDHLQAWWLIVFSGGFIFILILSLQSLGYRLISAEKVKYLDN